MAKLTLPPAHRRVGEALQALFAAKGAQGYLVGGYVRNLLLGLPPADLDIASALLPEEVVQAAADNARHGLAHRHPVHVPPLRVRKREG